MRKIIALLVTVACVVPALALAAADPAKNSHFKWCKPSGACPLDFDTNKAGTKMINMSLYPKCAGVPVKPDGEWPPIRVRNGKFSKKGTLTDFTGKTITYEISGKFTRPRKAVGTFDVDSKGCTDSEHKFTAKRDGKAQGSPY